MDLDEALWRGLDVAINEADFCDMRINERRGEVQLLLVVLTLPEQGPEPKDRRRLVCCGSVARIVAALRHETGHDGRTPVEPLSLPDLPAVVRSFGCQPVYGWQFIDVGGEATGSWREVPSIDFSVGKGRGSHSIDLFQEGINDDRRRFDLRVEFDELSVLDQKGREMPLEEFVAGGRRWWAAFQANDPRTEGHGLSRPGG